MSEIHKTAQSQEKNANSQENQHKKEINKSDKHANDVSCVEEEAKNAGESVVVDSAKTEQLETKDRSTFNVQNIKIDVASDGETCANAKSPEDASIEANKTLKTEKDSGGTTSKDKEEKDEILDKDEEICFESRARLYRYNTEKSSWKERGTGKVQLMKHKETGKVRILMRRDQTFIICCNHFITPEMYLKPLETSSNTLTWYTAGDHYDGETNSEVMAIKLPGAVLKTFETIFNHAIKNDQKALAKIVQERSQDK